MTEREEMERAIDASLAKERNRLRDVAGLRELCLEKPHLDTKMSLSLNKATYHADSSNQRTICSQWQIDKATIIAKASTYQQSPFFFASIAIRNRYVAKWVGAKYFLTSYLLIDESIL